MEWLVIRGEEKSTFVTDLALASLAKALPSVTCERRGEQARGILDRYWRNVCGGYAGFEND